MEDILSKCDLSQFVTSEFGCSFIAAKMHEVIYSVRKTVEQ